MNYLKSLHKLNTVDITVARETANASARIWIKANYPNEPRWTDRYKAFFQSYVKSYLDTYRHEAVKNAIKP